MIHNDEVVHQVSFHTCSSSASLSFVSTIQKQKKRTNNKCMDCVNIIHIPTGGRTTGPNIPTGGRTTGPNIPTGGQTTGPNIPTGGQTTGSNIPTSGQTTGTNIPTGGRTIGPLVVGHVS